MFVLYVGLGLLCFGAIYCVALFVAHWFAYHLSIR